MASFLEVCRAVVPEARPVAPGPLAARPIAWVRVLKPRVPAFDALDPGDLAIVPAAALAVVAPSVGELEALVDGLAEAGVGGVLLLGDGTRPLADALAAREIPVAVASGGDPAAIERSAIAFLVNRRAELDRQAGELERAVEGHVLAGRGPDAIAATIAGFVGRPVVLERRRGDPLAIHVPADRAERVASGATAVAAYHAKPAAVPYRHPLPGADGRPVGSIVILGDAPVRERERLALERIATVVALSLGAGAAGEPLPAAAREVLPAAGPPWALLIARQAGEGVADDRLESREQVRRDVRLYAGPDRLVLRGDAASLELRAVLAGIPDDPRALLLAERIGAILGRPCALSRPFTEPGGRPAAEAEARATLEAVERLPRADRPKLARADRLAAYRLVGELSHLPDGLAQAHALLAPLLEGSVTAVAERLATLRAILERDAGTEAAAALGVHRNTVAYRVRRLEELGGWDLTDPHLRLALTIAVRLVQSAQVASE